MLGASFSRAGRKEFFRLDDHGEGALSRINRGLPRLRSIASRRGARVRITLTIDDALLARAMQLTGIRGRSKLATEGLRALIRREEARKKLADLGLTPATIGAAIVRVRKPVRRKR